MNRSLFTLTFAKLKLFFIACVCLSVMACSPSFIYKNLDWMIPWYAEGYVVLNEEQQEHFTLIIDEALAWHKEQELPRYQQYLQDIHVKLDRPLNEDDISGIQTFTSSSFQTLQQRIIPALLPLFKTLDADQQQAFWAKLNKKHAEYEKEFISTSNEDHINDMNEKYTEFAEKLLGFLTEEQKLIIDNRVGNVMRTDDIWLNTRRAWLNDVKVQYEKKTNDWQTRVQAAWLNRGQHYSTVDKLKIDERDQQARQLLLAVINSRTDKQTEHFKKFIQSWQGKLTRWQE